MSLRRAFSKPTRSDADFDRLLRGFRAEGYEGLQLKTGQFSPFLADPDGYLLEWGDDAGRVSGLIAFDTLDDAGLARLEATVAFASRVGAERVVFCHNLAREGVDRGARTGFAKTLSEVGARAAGGGVRLSLHHHFEQPVMTRDDVAEFFEATLPGTIGLTVDTAHLAKSGVTDIPGFIREFAPIIDNIHLKDFQDGQWRLLGQGALDLVGILDALRAMSYAEWLCVDEESGADLETGLRASREWLDANETSQAAGIRAQR